jgi:hypothetical protein
MTISASLSGKSQGIRDASDLGGYVDDETITAGTYRMKLATSQRVEISLCCISGTLYVLIFTKSIELGAKQNVSPLYVAKSKVLK